MEALEVRKVLQEIDPKLHLEVEEVAVLFTDELEFLTRM